MKNTLMDSAREQRFVMSTIIVLALCAAGIVAALATGRLAGSTLLTSLLAGSVIGLCALATRGRAHTTATS